MRMTYLKLYQYRNYETLELIPHERLTVLLGKNAQGKTNVLEAIELCATGRSHRTVRDVQMIQREKDVAYIRLEAEQKARNRRIEIRMAKNKGKQIKIDGVPISRMGELMGCFHAVMFSPEDLRLVKDGPSERRRFMDIELSQIAPVYFYALSNYLHANQNRNALLKSLQNGVEDQGQLLIWDEQLARHGAQIYMQRRAFMQSLRQIARDVHARLSDGRECLHLFYDSDIDAATEEEAQQAIQVLLLEQRKEDIRRGMTQKGIHRDDIGMTLNEMDVRSYASQGQQRTAALAMKISELHLMRDWLDDAPVFLLDDVLSELDAHRQAMLLEATRDFQTFLTTTHWDRKEEGGIYWVEEGTLRKKE